MSLSPTPNLQLIYVSDVELSTAFYKKLFNADPIFTTPKYVAFSSGPESIFSLWSDRSTLDANAERFSEIGIMLPSNKDVEDLFQQWKDDEDIKILQPPIQEVFGTTFLVKDPDGHVIRVCPLD